MKKKIFTLLIICLAICGQTMADAPVSGKKYYIKNVDAGLYLSAIRPEGDFPVIDYLLAANPDFQFEFTALTGANEGYYSAAARGNTLALKAEGGWDLIFATYNNGDGAFAFKLIEESGKYKISFKPKEPSVLGLDKLIPGSRIYTDKGDGNHPLWEITEVPDNIELEVSLLTPANGANGVSHTDNLLVAFNDNVTQGTGSITIKDESEVEVANVNFTVNNNIVTITHDLFAPLTTYTVTFPAGVITGFDGIEEWIFTTSEAATLPADGHTYKIKLEDTETYLTLVGDLADGSWLNNNFEDANNQKFTVINASNTLDANPFPDQFVLKDQDGNYFRNDREGLVSNQTESVIFKYEVAGGYIKLINVSTNLYLGPYGTGPGNWVHFKGNGEAFQNWKLIDLTQTSIVTPAQKGKAIAVYASGNEVFVNAAAKEKVVVYSTNGAIVKQTTDTHFTLNSGFYIVKVGAERVKVVVR